MKSVLFVAHHLTIGGIQKSLVSALNSIDYNAYNVTIYLRKNRLDLLPYINKNVKIIVNDDKNHYYLKPKTIFLQVLVSIAKLLKLKKNEKNLSERLADYIRDAMFKNEYKKHFSDKSFDVAVSYWQGYNTLFVDKYIDAKEKIMFFQASVDEAHKVHQETMPHFDKIVVEHEDIKTLLCSWYDDIDKKIVIMDNYTNPGFLKQMCTEFEVNKPDNTTVLSTCARFSPDKGIDLAVEAARLLKERSVKFVWYLVGDGPTRDKVEQLIEQYELKEYVVLTGMQKNPYPYMNASDIYVQPSYHEALSIAMLESQLLGIPMVTTKTPGGLVMVKDGVNGYLADINAKALADAIEKMIVNSTERIKMKDYLMSIDYSEEKLRYETDWRNLLGD